MGRAFKRGGPPPPVKELAESARALARTGQARATQLSAPTRVMLKVSSVHCTGHAGEGFRLCLRFVPPARRKSFGGHS